MCKSPVKRHRNIYIVYANIYTGCGNISASYGGKKYKIWRIRLYWVAPVARGMAEHLETFGKKSIPPFDYYHHQYGAHFPNDLYWKQVECPDDDLDKLKLSVLRLGCFKATRLMLVRDFGHCVTVHVEFEFNSGKFLTHKEVSDAINELLEGFQCEPGGKKSNGKLSRNMLELIKRHFADDPDFEGYIRDARPFYLVALSNNESSNGKCSLATSNPLSGDDVQHRENINAITAFVDSVEGITEGHYFRFMQRAETGDQAFVRLFYELELNIGNKTIVRGYAGSGVINGIVLHGIKTIKPDLKDYIGYAMDQMGMLICYRMSMIGYERYAWRVLNNHVSERKTPLSQRIETLHELESSLRSAFEVRIAISSLITAAPFDMSELESIHHHISSRIQTAWMHIQLDAMRARSARGPGRDG